MTKLFLIFLFLLCMSVAYSQEADSTRLKTYENYLSQTNEQIKTTQGQLEKLTEYLQQLAGARSAFELVVSDEKKRLAKSNETNTKDTK